ncbi:hypothetical protein N7468_005609 [Penicillium chermesinum]|uniref:Uncharacterized protein n=1 Tax=Penicillium chermesinum TaxID=63820 RepID=A0A9W9NZL6_9EURO|nr:uncharacterized protein N7468_005609 [Penicillium chermesinum]KAJ5232653.1 hypothetical protein N7468_005609 [Penicillium chermesinum]
MIRSPHTRLHIRHGLNAADVEPDSVLWILQVNIQHRGRERLISDLLAEGLLLQVEDGWPEVLNNFELVRQGSVYGKNLVYHLLFNFRVSLNGSVQARRQENFQPTRESTIHLRPPRRSMRGWIGWIWA